MKSKALLLALSLAILIPIGQASAIDADEDYNMGRQAVKSGNKDIAFMHFFSILKNNPKSKYREETLFSVAEYYYNVSDIPDASSSFREFLKDYPDSERKPFVLFYLLKIAQRQNDGALVKQIENEIVNLKQVVLVFKNKHELKYKSLFGTKYRLAYYIDKIECYVNGRLFAQFSY